MTSSEVLSALNLLENIWQVKGWLKKLSMFRLFSRPNIDFMGIRYYWFTATILLTVLGITVFLVRMPITRERWSTWINAGGAAESAWERSASAGCIPVSPSFL